ncbi:hypothetical protein [Streptomyces sp. NRRL B-1347]|uniref:hypothetical protein n=1 Tax=Streptomyces sp. NRRL B-1347 TaxID=1476877 RepID=UPI001F2839E9|nr:hypothetical protein [Streptomyces sp. NRRL B-1347]
MLSQNACLAEIPALPPYADRPAGSGGSASRPDIANLADASGHPDVSPNAELRPDVSPLTELAHSPKHGPLDSWAFDTQLEPFTVGRIAEDRIAASLELAVWNRLAVLQLDRVQAGLYTLPGHYMRASIGGHSQGGIGASDGVPSQLQNKIAPRIGVRRDGDSDLDGLRAAHADQLRGPYGVESERLCAGDVGEARHG